MDYTISCETFVRLASIAVQPDEDAFSRNYLRTVRIEHHNGKIVAIASNGKLLAGEFLGETDIEGALSIIIDPSLIKLASDGIGKDESMIFTQAPGWTVARRTDGAMFPLNAEAAVEWPDWRALIPKEQPAKNAGVMAFYMNSVERLIKASPSGTIILPKFFDPAIPCVVRDELDQNWFGMFLIGNGDKKQNFGPAQIPEWLK